MQKLPDNNKPIYIQIRDMLEDMIVKGLLNEEEQTPSTTELANFYKINHITVGKGINQLVDEGILYKKRGIGMFVTEGAREKLLESRRNQFVEHYIRPMMKEAENLDLSDEMIYRLIQREREDK